MPEPAHRDLRPLFAPRSLAVLGASDAPGKWGNRLARAALRGAACRSVFLVNRRQTTVLGEPAYPSLAVLPEPPELVAICVPAAGFEQAVDDALAAGARALVGISAGLGETGPAGLERERRVVERIRAAGALMLGPNCLGVFDAEASFELGWDPYPPGGVGLLSQSGNLALDLGLALADVGLGFSRVASLGNQADLGAAELLDAFRGHETTRVVAAYVEDFRDGREFARAAARLTATGTPVLLLTPGDSDAARRAARSHTGALVSDLDAVDAACRASGVVRVATPRELVDRAQASLAEVRSRGRRVVIVGDGGGHGVLAADAATRSGLLVPPLEPELVAELGAALPGTAGISNPIDLAGASDDWLGAFDSAVGIAFRSNVVDAGLVTGYFAGYGTMSPEYAEPELATALALAAAVRSVGKPIVVHTMYPASDTSAALRKAGVPVYRDVEAACAALAWLAAIGETGERSPVPELPAAAAAVVASGYFEARELLAASGIPFAEARRADDVDSALAAARELGYPVVLKAIGALHKSDAGGVRLGIQDDRELEREARELLSQLAADGLSVERMARVADGVELIVGCRRDPRFGPIVLVGLGGTLAETLADTAVALAPCGTATAERLLRSLRGAAVLTGVRGRPALAISRAAEVAALLSRVAAEHPELAELELNPLLVTTDGAIALDARLITRAETGHDTPGAHMRSSGA